MSVYEEVIEYTRLYKQFMEKFGAQPGPSDTQLESFMNRATPEQRERTLRHMQRRLNEQG